MLAKLPGVDEAIVRTSPLQRARDTCALAGFGDRAEVWPELAEWDYGVYKGRRAAEIRESVPGWSVWTEPIEGASTSPTSPPGPTQSSPAWSISTAPALLFAHAHLLRILGARWCGLAPSAGRALTIDPGGISILGWEHEYRVVERWNLATISAMSADSSTAS